MEIIVLVNICSFAIVGGIGTFIGLDLKKWSSWLFGLYGFLSGSLVGLIEKPSSLDFQLGAIFAFVVMYGGAMSHFHRQRYKGALDAWLLRYGQGEHPILVVRIMKKLMGRD